MGRTLVYIDANSPQPRHREAAPPGAAFRQARIPAVEAELNDTPVTEVIIGTPDAGSDIAAHRQWATIKAKYEEERRYRDSDVQAEVVVNESMNPEAQRYEPDLAAAVGESAAQALAEAGYGTLAAAKALGEDVTEIDGIGSAKHEALQEA